MYKKGKERVATVFGSKIFQDGKEAILDTAEEGFIRAYNLGQKVNDKFFKFGRKNKTEEENNDKQKIYEQEPISEEEKEEINKFETNIDRVNRIQKEQDRKNTNKVYGNIFKGKLGEKWLERYTDSEGRTRALSRKKFFDQQKGIMVKGDNIRTRALRDLRNRLGLRRR